MGTEAEKPVFKVEDLQAHTTDQSCWLAVGGKVYDVTDFLEEHPGGYDIILSSTGKDATRDFEEIGHSKSARTLLEKYLIGRFEGVDPAQPVDTKAPAAAAVAPAASQSISGSTRLFNVVLPIALLAAAVALNYYLTSKQQATATA